MFVTVRRALVSAAATTLLLALAGCGGNDATAKDSSSSSSSASADALSGTEFVDLLKGAIDKATTAHVTLDLGGSMGTAAGDADFTKSPPEAAIKLSMGQLGDAEVRLVDGTLYLKSASLGDKWVSTSMDDAKSPLGPLGQQLDLTKTIETFADSVTSATDKGSEDVDGESLHHYTATVDPQKLVASLPSSAGTGSLPKTMTQDWWFDKDGLLRKFSSDLGGTSVTVTLSDWGKDVSIEAPPADQVTTMGQSKA